MSGRRPQMFQLDDPALNVDETEESPADQSAAMTIDLPDADETPISRAANPSPTSKGIGWGSVFFAAVLGLISLSAGIWISSFVMGLFARNDWVGALALSLLGLAIFAASMIMLREARGLMRLRRMTHIRKTAEQLLDEDVTLGDARNVVTELKALYATRKDLRWGLERLKSHERDVLDAKDLVLLAERELMIKLDAQAKSLVARSARRISVVTAISPAAFIDVIYVALENLKLLHKIASLYGGRPGSAGVFKLARMVVTHLTLTGGLALSSDLIHQFVGQRLTAKLSARLGEGIFNGALSARIGMAAIHICRPLPFIEAKPPRFLDFFGELMSKQKKSDSDG